jgi:hypothetical protein
MEDWVADEQANVTENCTSWCTALLWIVPAQVQGTWQLPQGTLQLTQQFQMLSGTLAGATISDAKMTGDQIAFTAGGVKFTGTVSGNTMKGTASSGGAFTATKK